MIPELRLFPTPAARRRAIAATWGDLHLFCRFLSPHAVALLVVTVLLCNLLAKLRTPPLLMTGAVLLQWLFLAAVIVVPFIRGFRRTLRRSLIEAGITICWQCGYDLRGSPPATAACPECGAACSEAARRLQRTLPQSATFPELTAFDDEAAASAALRTAEESLGILYRRRLRIGIALGVASTIIVVAILNGLDLAYDLDRRTEFFWPTGLVMGITVVVWTFIAWYGYLRRRTRAELQHLLEGASKRRVDREA